MSEVKNLREGLHDEMNRVREIVKAYEELPNSAGMPAAELMKANIKQAEKAIESGSVISMAVALKGLKEWEM